MPRVEVVNGSRGSILMPDGEVPLLFRVLYLDDYFKDRFSPTKVELEMFQMVTGIVPIVEDRCDEKL